MKDHWKTISDGSNTILSNIERTRTSFFEHRKNTNVFIYWWSNSNTLFLASNDRTSNFEPNRAFTRFTKSLFELTPTSLFRTSNELERVHLLVIKLKHSIFGFERSNIELWTLFHPSLRIGHTRKKLGHRETIKIKVVVRHIFQNLLKPFSKRFSVLQICKKGHAQQLLHYLSGILALPLGCSSENE